MRRNATATFAARAGRILPVVVLVLLACVAGAAEPPKGHSPIFDPGEAPAQGVRQAPRPLAERSADRIVREVERRHKARLLKDPREREVNGRKILVLTLIDDKKGRVWEVQVDVETGKELKD